MQPAEFESLVRVIRESEGRLAESLGRLAAEVGSARAELTAHTQKDDARHAEDDKRFRVLEGTDAAITGEFRVAAELKKKVESLDARRAQVATAVVTAVVTTIVAVSITALITHVAWR